jgi:hypothetical protein
MFAPKAKTIKIKIPAQDNFKNLFVLAPTTKQSLILVLLKERKSNFAKLLAPSSKDATNFSRAWNSLALLQHSTNAHESNS